MSRLCRRSDNRTARLSDRRRARQRPLFQALNSKFDRSSRHAQPPYVERFSHRVVIVWCFGRPDNMEVENTQGRPAPSPSAPPGSPGQAGQARWGSSSNLDLPLSIFLRKHHFIKPRGDIHAHFRFPRLAIRPSNGRSRAAEVPRPHSPPEERRTHSLHRAGRPARDHAPRALPVLPAITQRLRRLR